MNTGKQRYRAVAAVQVGNKWNVLERSITLKISLRLIASIPISGPNSHVSSHIVSTSFCAALYVRFNRCFQSHLFFVILVLSDADLQDLNFGVDPVSIRLLFASSFAFEKLVDYRSVNLYRCFVPDLKNHTEWFRGLKNRQWCAFGAGVVVESASPKPPPRACTC